MTVPLLIRFRNRHVPPMTAVAVVLWRSTLSQTLTDRHDKLFLRLCKRHILPVTRLISSSQQPTHTVLHTD